MKHASNRSHRTGAFVAVVVALAVIVAGSIDDRGRIVGGYYDASGATHGFLRDTRGRFRTIDVPGAKGTTASRINDRGQIAAGTYHGYVWRKGRFRTVDMPGATATSLVDVNDRGAILGSYLDDAARFRGFVLRNGNYRTFDAPRAAYMLPRDINNRGQIAGFTLDDLDLTGARGFLLARGVGGPFTAIDVPGAPRNLVFGLNDRGQIVGAYENTNATPTAQ
jgi:uncharacterized membrane protein